MYAQKHFFKCEITTIIVGNFKTILSVNVTKLAKFVPCKTYFMVTINLQIVDIIIIKSSFNSVNSCKFVVTTNSCKYYLKTRWTEN